MGIFCAGMDKLELSYQLKRINEGSTAGRDVSKITPPAVDEAVEMDNEEISLLRSGKMLR